MLFGLEMLQVEMLQWTGRTIRTEDDRAVAICYDT